LSKEERERIKSVVSQNLGSLSRYDAKLHRTKSIAVTDILHDEAEQNSTHESYPVAIAEELLTLAETFHPLFAESPTALISMSTSALQEASTEVNPTTQICLLD